MGKPESKNQQIKLYAGPEHECGYLADRIAISMFTDPTMPMDNYLYSQLSRLGFRRSGNHVYRPKCLGCSACWSYRVMVDDFKPNKTQRRVLKANSGLRVSLEPARIGAQDYELYEQYICLRHKDGEMYPPSFEQYSEFLFSDWCDSAFLRVTDNDKTIALMFLDCFDDGFSAVYSFFDCSEEANKKYKSLGVFLILKTIEACKKLELPYSYLGFYINNCDKMSYKIHYKPAQTFQNNSWITHDK